MAVTDICFMVGDDKDFVVRIPQTLNDPTDIVMETNLGQGKLVSEIPLGSLNVPVDIVVDGDSSEAAVIDNLARPTVVVNSPRRVR